MDGKIEQLSKILKESNHIVFFGGAGVSTASGIPDFRSSNGLYSKKSGRNFSPEQAVSHSFLIHHTEEFYEFYKKNLIYPDAKPNACHYALAKLEKMGKLKAIVTQNIDSLHQKAGSYIVYELHGTVKRNYCVKCHALYDDEFILKSVGIPKCETCGGMVRPDVVLYEEGLDQEIIGKAIHEISMADTLIIGGTSLVVYPAAGLIDYFKGKKLVLINKTSTSADTRADFVIHDDIAQVMEKAVSLLQDKI